jgi:succinoglycan biosynthesis protein ExoU
MTEGCISVIIPAYNAAATVGRAIASALAEPEVGAVVVVDDCSTDDTRAIVLAADDGSGRLSYHALDRNSGPATARNVALAQNDLPLVALLDSDDYLLPGRFARMLAAGGDAWDFLADNILFTPSGAGFDAQIAAATQPAPVLTRSLDLAGFVAGNISNPLRQRAELGFIKPLFRRGVMTKLALAYDPSLRLGEDYVLYCHALMRGARFTLVSCCGYVAVERARSLSGLHRTQDLEALLHADRALIEEARSIGVSRTALGLLQRHNASLITRVDIRQAIELAHRRGRYRALASLSLTPLRLGRIAWGVLGDRLGNASASRRNGIRKLLADKTFG